MSTTPTIVEIGQQLSQGTLRQRWSHYFVLLYALVSFVVGINLRDSTLNAVTGYVDLQSGVRAAYPQAWVIDRQGDYVFRVRDLSRVGFKTAIIVDTQPVSLNATTRNLLDAILLDRANTLTGFQVLAVDDTYTLPDGTPATSMTYTFVDVEVNPVLQTLPIVVEGIDVIAIRQGQSVVVSFLADANTFEQDQAVFDRFLTTLEF